MFTKTCSNADGIKVLRWVKNQNNYASRMLGLIRLGSSLMPGAQLCR